MGGPGPCLKEANKGAQVQPVVFGYLTGPAVSKAVFHGMLEMQTRIGNCLIVSMACGLNEIYWQAPFTWEPVYHPRVGFENKALFSCLISLPESIPVLSSVLHSTARLIP